MRYCSIAGCEREHVARGLCIHHYDRAKRSKTLYRYRHEKDLTIPHATRLPEYGIWGGMKHRCFNPRSRTYEGYGGRGITVCARWRASFAAFYKDIGPRPSKSHSIDRIDNDKNYSCGKCEECLSNGWPANCRWATPIEQANNKRIGYKSATMKRSGKHPLNRTGYMGVYKQGRRWRAALNVSLGVFDSPEDASEAYMRGRAWIEILLDRDNRRFGKPLN